MTVGWVLQHRAQRLYRSNVTLGMPTRTLYPPIPCTLWSSRDRGAGSPASGTTSLQEQRHIGRANPVPCTHPYPVPTRTLYPTRILYPPIPCALWNSHWACSIHACGWPPVQWRHFAPGLEMGRCKPFWLTGCAARLKRFSH